MDVGRQHDHGAPLVGHDARRLSTNVIVTLSSNDVSLRALALVDLTDDAHALVADQRDDVHGPQQPGRVIDEE